MFDDCASVAAEAPSTILRSLRALRMVPLPRFRLRAPRFGGLKTRRSSRSERRRVAGAEEGHLVFSKISRPMSMRRISLVPAPIS